MELICTKRKAGRKKEKGRGQTEPKGLRLYGCSNESLMGRSDKKEGRKEGRKREEEGRKREEEGREYEQTTEHL